MHGSVCCIPSKALRGVYWTSISEAGYPSETRRGVYWTSTEEAGYPSLTRRGETERSRAGDRYPSETRLNLEVERERSDSVFPNRGEMSAGAGGVLLP